MPKMNAARLSEFVQRVDANFGGNLNAPEVVAAYYPIEFEAETVVDQNLDPFSKEYFDQQLALYREIAGRDLNQWDGELHPVDVASLVNAPNPLGIGNVDLIGEHVRAVSTMLGVADLRVSPPVLDMGAGHGLSSEVLAFSGCIVHAIDIDPELGLLSKVRAASRSLPIQRSVLTFDDLSSVPDNSYTAAFFFQSFHHCLRPWELIASLRTKLGPDGVIAFTGEPIHKAVWRNWGLRLDQESLYVARKFGWFESGWSHEFLRACFERNGYKLHFLSGGHGGGEIGIAAVDSNKLHACMAKAVRMGLVERYPRETHPPVKAPVPTLAPDLDVLRSPAGHKLKIEGDHLICSGTGRSYPLVSGNAHLFDDADVPASLKAEASAFVEYADVALVPDLNFPAERVYAEAKAVNCELMFSALDYEAPETRRVVELGAWRCESTIRLADMGFDAYAVDFFPGMVDNAARAHGGRPFHRVAAPMANLPFQDRSVDLVFMHATLHHALPRREDDFRWYDPANMLDALREIRRILKPDGALFLLGEGVYPEGLPVSERYHEQKAQAGESFYESWYTPSEYESVFAAAGIFPNLMSNQDNLQLDLHGYADGQRVQLVKFEDNVRLADYHRVGEMAAWNAGADWAQRLLPSWIRAR